MSDVNADPKDALAGKASTDGGGLTEMLNSAKDHESINAFIEVVYPNLRRLAAGQLRGNLPGSDIGVTALVNETYPHLRHALQNPKLAFENRRRFFAFAATIMRRTRSRLDRERAVEEVLDENQLAETSSPFLRLLIDTEMDRIRAVHPARVTAFELHYYTGLTIFELAEVIGCVPHKAKAMVAYVRSELAKRFRAAAEGADDASSAE